MPTKMPKVVAEIMDAYYLSGYYYKDEFCVPAIGRETAHDLLREFNDCWRGGVNMRIVGQAPHFWVYYEFPQAKDNPF